MSKCNLCKNSVTKVYALNSYDLGQCEYCKSISVIDMPSSNKIEEFYQGFNFQTSMENFNKIKSTAVELWMKSLLPAKKGKMLDVGGGGGFFAKAYEDFGLGESTYIDLDREACTFAKEKMELPRVFCDTVENITKHTGSVRYDFIYCRHVIEHLVNPSDLIRQCADLLSEDGVFVVQCPNGSSKEGIFYPKYWQQFLRQAKRSNDWSKLHAMMFSLTPKYGWGIDPIRHLWAITGKGIESIFRDSEDFVVKISSASLNDRVYSPYWVPTNRYERVTSKVAHLLADRIISGLHLVVQIRRRR